MPLIACSQDVHHALDESSMFASDGPVISIAFSAESDRIRSCVRTYSAIHCAIERAQKTLRSGSFQMSKTEPSTISFALISDSS